MGYSGEWKLGNGVTWKELRISEGSGAPGILRVPAQPFHVCSATGEGGEPSRHSRDDRTPWPPSPGQNPVAKTAQTCSQTRPRKSEKRVVSGMGLLGPTPGARAPWMVGEGTVGISHTIGAGGEGEIWFPYLAVASFLSVKSRLGLDCGVGN